MDEKAINQATQIRGSVFGHAFIAAADLVLTKEQFLELEIRASEILSSK